MFLNHRHSLCGDPFATLLFLDPTIWAFREWRCGWSQICVCRSIACQKLQRSTLIANQLDAHIDRGASELVNLLGDGDAPRGLP